MWQDFRKLIRSVGTHPHYFPELSVKREDEDLDFYSAVTDF